MNISSFITHHSSLPLLQAFARLPEAPPPPADDDDTYTVLLIILLATIFATGIVGAWQARIAYKRGYRDGLADAPEEQWAPEAPELPIQPRAWKPRRR